MTETLAAPPGKYLVDPYQIWAEAEGVPIHTGRALDVSRVDVRPWPRFDAQGAICHLEGRCDFLALFVVEIAGGKEAAPQRHLYEQVSYVVSGEGETEVDCADGGTFTIPWAAGTIFSVPMNARYRIRNAGAKPARIAAFNDLRYLLSLFRNERFIFDNPHAAPVVANPADLARDLAPGRAVPSPLQLGDGTIGTDVIELAARRYATARRQMQGAHVLCAGGEGYTLSWREGSGDFVRADWSPGVVIGLAGMSFHQHFNPGRAPARLVGIELGSSGNPMFRSRRHAYGDASVYASGSAEIAAGQEDPRILAMWRDAIS